MWNASDGSSYGYTIKIDSKTDDAVFSNGQARILTSHRDGSARLWDATDGSAAGQTMQHEDWVNGAVFNHDDTRVLTWSNDGTARMWDVNDGLPVGQPIRHHYLTVDDYGVIGASFNQNETRILTWSNEAVTLWNVEIDDDFPKEYLTLMVNVVTGTTMDDYGNISLLSTKKWKECRSKYIRIAFPTSQRGAGLLGHP